MYEMQFEAPAIRVEFETNGTGGYLTIQEVAEIVIKQLYMIYGMENYQLLSQMVVVLSYNLNLCLLIIKL